MIWGKVEIFLIHVALFPFKCQTEMLNFKKNFILVLVLSINYIV